MAIKVRDIRAIIEGLEGDADVIVWVKSKAKPNDEAVRAPCEEAYRSIETQAHSLNITVII